MESHNFFSEICMESHNFRNARDSKKPRKVPTFLGSVHNLYNVSPCFRISGKR